MKAGKIRYIFLIFIFYSFFLNADDKISTVPLVNLEELKPSYEEIEDENNKIKTEKKYTLQEKNIKKNKGKIAAVNLMGLDKITAKTSEINIKIGETKKFGLLEIKAIKCGVTESINEFKGIVNESRESKISALLTEIICDISGKCSIKGN